MTSRLALLAAIALPLADAGAGPGAAAQDAGPVPVLTRTGQVQPRLDALWAQSVRVDVDALGAAAAAGRPVALDVAPGLSLTTTPERVTRRGVGRFTWYGPVSGGGRATLTVEGSHVVGRIVVPGRAILIEPVDSGHIVFEPEFIGDDIDDALPPPPRAAQAISGGDALFPDELHLAVFYTSQVADSLGAGVGAFVQATADQVTDVLANSNIAMSARLVLSGQVVHTETQQLSGNLSMIQDPGDGVMDEVHDLRDAASADMVALLVETGTNSATGCGVAYLMSSLDEGFESAAFSVTKRRCAMDLVFSHEVGHNLGLHHDIYVAPGPGLFNYSHGFVNIDSMNTPPGRPGFRTPLAYHAACADAGGECVRIPYYSNPELLFNGQPMGNATTADNARTVRQSGPLTATFRAPQLLGTVDGNTVGAPTWNRPFCPDPDAPASCELSGTATAVPYTMSSFTVTRAGRHYVRATAPFDGVLVLYAGTFDHGSPLAGIVGYAEPDASAPAGRRVLLSADLAVGIPYVLVTTGLTNGDAGVFSDETYGPEGGGVVVALDDVPDDEDRAALTLGEPTPNPTGARATLVLTSAATQRIRTEVFDALGRSVSVLHDGAVAAGVSLPLVIDTERMPAGVYVVRASGDAGVVSRRLTVLR